MRRSTVGGVLENPEHHGLSLEKTVLLGFSQGACLALEYAARHPRRYGGVVAFSGGLIGSGEQEGTPPNDKIFTYDGSLDGTSVFVGCSDHDPHVPLRRIEQTAEAFDHLGAPVTKRIYEGMGTRSAKTKSSSRAVCYPILCEQKQPATDNKPPMRDDIQPGVTV